MVYAKFGGQRECIMGNSKIENYERKSTRKSLLLAPAQIVARGVATRIASHPEVLLVRHAIRGAGRCDEPLRTSACETTTRILTYRTRCLAHRFSS